MYDVCVTGDSILSATSWMLTMEGRVLTQPHELTDFSSAMAALFSCFSVFNVQNQEEASNTLESFRGLYHK